MMKRALLCVLLVVGTLTPAAARTTTSVSVSYSPSAHRTSGTACSSGGRYCATIGCAIAPVLPVTSEEISTVPYSTCRVDFAVIVTGRAMSRGRPVAGAAVIARSNNRDEAQCWPDTWIASVASCKAKVVRAARTAQTTTDKRGYFSLMLPPDAYQAGHMELPVDQIRSCKDVPITLLVRIRESLTTKRSTLHACV